MRIFIKSMAICIICMKKYQLDGYQQLRDLDKYKDKISTEQIIENVKNEMDADAQIYTREHKLEQ